MAEFNINSFKFPTTFDKSVNQGEILQIDINLIGLGLEKPVIYDLNKQEKRITIIDSSNRLYSIRMKLIELDESTRTQTGTYSFIGKVNTKNLKKGTIKVVGYVYNLRGEVVPIRQLHKVV